MLARIHLYRGQPSVIHQPPHHLAGGVIVVVLAAAFIFLAGMARLTRSLAVLVSDLVQVAAAATSVLFTIVIAAGILAVLLLHG